jgi:predicted DNA-binding ArsR family transcriptional regulator
MAGDGRGEVARTQDVWGAEGISGRVKFLLLAWAGMPNTSFRKNSDSPRPQKHLHSYHNALSCLVSKEFDSLRVYFIRQFISLRGGQIFCLSQC